MAVDAEGHQDAGQPLQGPLHLLVGGLGGLAAGGGEKVQRREAVLGALLPQAGLNVLSDLLGLPALGGLLLGLGPGFFRRLFLGDRLGGPLRGGPVCLPGLGPAGFLCPVRLGVGGGLVLGPGFVQRDVRGLFPAEEGGLGGGPGAGPPGSHRDHRGKVVLPGAVIVVAGFIAVVVPVVVFLVVVVVVKGLRPLPPLPAPGQDLGGGQMESPRQEEEHHQHEDDPRADLAEPGGEGDPQKAPQDAAAEAVDPVPPQGGEGPQAHVVGIGGADHVEEGAEDHRKEAQAPHPAGDPLLPDGQQDHRRRRQGGDGQPDAIAHQAPDALAQQVHHHGGGAGHAQDQQHRDEEAHRRPHAPGNQVGGVDRRFFSDGLLLFPGLRLFRGGPGLAGVLGPGGFLPAGGAVVCRFLLCRSHGLRSLLGLDQWKMAKATRAAAPTPQQ